MKINQYAGFKKVYKKLRKNQLAQVNAAIQSIIDNPGLGERKKGFLELPIYFAKVGYGTDNGHGLLLSRAFVTQ
jgi:hypothetical protein